MRRTYTVFCASALAVLAGLAYAVLPIADEVPITASGGQAIPSGSLSVEFLADGSATVTFFDSGNSKERDLALRADKPREFKFAGESWDSVYFALDTATEIVPTWKAE